MLPLSSSGLPVSGGFPSGRTTRNSLNPLTYLALLRTGFTEPNRSPGTLVRSYRTVSPLPLVTNLLQRRFAFCCTFRPLALLRWLRPSRYEAYCPVEFGLSSFRQIGTRLPVFPALKVNISEFYFSDFYFSDFRFRYSLLSSHQR